MKKYLPSKKFVKFMLIFLVVLVALFSFSIFYKKKTVVENNSKQVDFFTNDVNFYTLDSDDDKVYDWEESLWGLNPKEMRSNPLGIVDGEYVEIKRKEITESEAFNDSGAEELSRTDVLARQFLSTAAILRENGGLDEGSLEIFSKSFDEVFSNTEVRDAYSMENLKISNVSPVKYKESLSIAFQPIINSGIEELDLIYRFASGDKKAAEEMEELIGIYRKLTEDLSAVETPANLANFHLGMINNSAKLSVVFMSIKVLEQDPVSAMVGFGRYEEYSKGLFDALSGLGDYFESNGII